MDDPRVANITGSHHCKICCEVPGFVAVDVGNGGRTLDEHRLLRQVQRERATQGKPPLPVYGEALAPCPACELGGVTEFPTSGVGPWGADGFWRGHFLPLESTCRCGEAVTPKGEGAGLVRALLDAIGLQPVTP